ncbi:MAG: GAF domain-containing protein [Opitutales bacterium]
MSGLPKEFFSTQANAREALEAYAILDTDPQQEFDDIVRIAATSLKVPVALVSFLCPTRQWFKAKIGMEVSETPIEQSFCAHAVAQNATLVVEDATEDPRFARNSLVTDEPHLRFYAGAPLVSPEGARIGSLCVIDYTPRTISSEQIETLESLARQVIAQLELRRLTAGAAASQNTSDPVLPELSSAAAGELDLKTRAASALKKLESLSLQAAHQAALETLSEVFEAVFEQDLQTAAVESPNGVCCGLEKLASSG